MKMDKEYKGFNYCMPYKHTIHENEVIWHISFMPLAGGREPSASNNPLLVQVCSYHFNINDNFRKAYDLIRETIPKGMESLL